MLDLDLTGINQVYVKGRAGLDSIEFTGTSSYETVFLRPVMPSASDTTLRADFILEQT